MNNVKEQLDANTTHADTPEEIVSKAIYRLRTDNRALHEGSVLLAIRDLQIFGKKKWKKLKRQIKAEYLAYDLESLENFVTEKEGPLPKAKQSSCDALIDLVNNACYLCCDQSKVAYAKYWRSDHAEVLPIESPRFIGFIRHLYYKKYDLAPSESATTDALATLAVQATYDGNFIHTAMRIEKFDGCHYIDLGDDSWEVVKVDPEAENWEIICDPPVAFLRTEAMRPLPRPSEGGRVEELWNFVNIPTEYQLLLLAWITSCYRGDIEYSLLELTGEQGSAKSSTQDILKQLIDPNKSNLRRATKKTENLFITALHNHLISFENVSRISNDLSDDLCSIVTGAGFSSRLLYTNTEESIIDVCRPVVINGIAVIVNRQDLLDRTLHIDMPKIRCRKSKSELLKSFEQVKSEIFGDLLDLFLHGLRNLPHVKIDSDKLPRLADFAIWGEAIYRAEDKKAGAFLEDFKKMQLEGVYRTIDSSPAALAMKRYAESGHSFDGIVSELLFELEDFKPEGESWPRSPRGLGDIIRRYGPSLRKIGIEARIASQRRSSGYRCILKKLE